MEAKTARVLQEVRLRNWDTGRLNLLKLAVQNLENSLNNSLNSPIVQTERRKISDQVPFVLDFAVRPGFRQVQCLWSAPPGLGGHPFRQLLFYELQHDSTPSFASPTTIQTANPGVSIAGLALGEEISFRIRIVNTFGNASIWSNTVTVTVAQSKIQQTTIDDVSIRLEGPIGYWRTVVEKTFTPLAANATINSHLALAGVHFNTDQRRSGVTRKTIRGGPAHVQFRWRIGSLSNITGNFELREFGQRTILSSRPGFANNGVDKSTFRNPLAFGTFITPFFKLQPGIQGKIQLQAAKMPGTEWRGQKRKSSLEISDPVFFFRNGKILEILEDL